MRGKRRLESAIRLDARNIPAYAGKTVVAPVEANSLKEHPRVCGENYLHEPLLGGTGGTSPRMRGKRILLIGHVLAGGNIPAYAGKTLK